MKGDVRTMVRDAVLEVLEDQAATVQRGDGVLRSGTKERRQALVFCAEAIASRVAERMDRGEVRASDNGNAAGRERATVDLDDLERKARAATPGPWIAGDDGEVRDEPLGKYLVQSIGRHPVQANAEHIAANSPPVTLALIARIRELEAAAPGDDEIHELRKLLAGLGGEMAAGSRRWDLERAGIDALKRLVIR